MCLFPSYAITLPIVAILFSLTRFWTTVHFWLLDITHVFIGSEPWLKFSIILIGIFVCVRSATQSCPTLWPRGLQHARLSLTISWSLPKFMAIALVMPSSDVFFSFCPQSFPALGLFQWISSLLSSFAQWCPTLCDPVDCSTPGFPAPHQLPEHAGTHVLWVCDAIQPSHTMSSPFPAFSLSHHQGIFQWVSSLHQVAKILELQLQHQSFQWIFRIDFL